MSKRLGGRFNGTGAALYLCFGFVPDWLKLWNVEAAVPLTLEWNKNMSDVLCNEGIYYGNDGGTLDLANGEGIAPYYGGDTLTTTTAGTVTYGEGVYLKADNHDYRYPNSGSHAPGDAVADIITTWTWDSGYTGHFNEDVTGTYIGEGSHILIDSGKGPREYTIVALTAGAGEASGEVTISATGIKSGLVMSISGMYTMKPMVAGEVTLQGVKINHTTINANGNTIAFEAGMYD